MQKIFKYALLVIALLFFIPHACKSYKEQKDSKHWPTTDGRLQEIHIKEVDSERRTTNGHTTRDHYYQLVLSYTYEVNSIGYTGTRLSVGGRRFHSEQLALDKMKKFQEMEVIPVYYNPQEPESSALEPG